MHPILKAFIPTANLIQKSSPFVCEVVLHDLSHPQRSVVYVAGDVTGRKVGQSFDHLVSEVLNSKNFKDDYVANYFFTKDEKLVKSSTAFIRDEHGEIIAIEVVAAKLNVSKITIYGYLDQLKKKRP